MLSFDTFSIFSTFRMPYFRIHTPLHTHIHNSVYKTRNNACFTHLSIPEINKKEIRSKNQKTTKGEPQIKRKPAEQILKIINGQESEKASRIGEAGAAPRFTGCSRRGNGSKECFCDGGVEMERTGLWFRIGARPFLSVKPTRQPHDL